MKHPEPWYTQPAQLLSAPFSAQYLRENRKFQGIPTIESAGGRLIAAWQIGGDKEPHEDNCCVLALSEDGGESWLDPYIVIDHPERSVRLCNPVLWREPCGRLWLFWSQSDAGETPRMGVWAVFCDAPDAERSELVWSAPRRLSDFIIINKPLALPDGSWLYSAQDFGDRKKTYVFSAGGGTPSHVIGCAETQNINSYFSEPMLLAYGSRLRMYTRLEKGADGGMECADSEDGGRTWSVFRSELMPPFRGPGTRFYIGRLRSGNLLFVNNDDASQRKNMTAYLSRDDGASWTGMLLDDRNYVSYPDVCEAEDGSICVIYDRNRSFEREILLVKFREKDFAQNLKPKIITVSQGGKKDDG